MPDEPIKGYVRAEGLSILATEAVLNKAKPLSGYLDIGTEDGRLRLRLFSEVPKLKITTPEVTALKVPP